jgi:hypothetical protein
VGRSIVFFLTLAVNTCKPYRVVLGDVTYARSVRTVAEVMIQIWATQAEQGKPPHTAPQLSIAKIKHSVSEAEFAVFFRCEMLLS